MAINDPMVAALMLLFLKVEALSPESNCTCHPAFMDLQHAWLHLLKILVMRASCPEHIEIGLATLGFGGTLGAALFERSLLVPAVIYMSCYMNHI